MHHATLLVLGLVLPFTCSQGVENNNLIGRRTVEGAESSVGGSHTSMYQERLDLSDSSLAILTRSLTRSGCHANIAATLKQSCKTKDGSDLNTLSEFRKRGIAISFTICSIQSASQQVPVECNPWHPSLLTQDEASITDHTRQEDKFAESLQAQQVSCLGALHRSPQEWSAYNVYLSDATQLCHALEARKQADLAHTRYLNATMEKIALLQLMKERELSQLSREAKLNQELETQTDGLRKAADFVLYAQNKMHQEVELSVELQQDLRSTLTALETERGIIWNRVEKDIKDRLFEADVRFENMVFDLKDTWATELASSFGNTLEKYDITLANHITETEKVVDKWLASVIVQFDGVVAYTNEQISVINASWGDLQRWIDLAGQELSTLDRGLNQLHNSLASSMQVSHNLNLAQREVTSSLEKAISQTDTLLNRQDFLEDSLNRSVNLVEKNLNLAARWKLSPTLALFSGPAAMSLSTFGGFSSQILLWSLHIICQVAYSMVSAFCFIFILFRTGLTKSVSRWYNQWDPTVEDEEASIYSITHSIKRPPTPLRAVRHIKLSSTITSSSSTVSDRRSRTQPKRDIRRSASAPL